MTSMIFYMLAIAQPFFSDMKVTEGKYEWLRLNDRGQGNANCLKDKDLESINVSPLPSDIRGELELSRDQMISIREKNGCRVLETIKLIHAQDNMVTLKLEDVQLSGCKNMEDVRRVNIERPYDDENLNFISSSFKILELTEVGKFLKFNRGQNSCFYAVRK